MNKLLFIVAVVTGSVAGLNAAERFVPSGGTLNYPTIQSALSVSAAGDVVRVQPGIYNESLVFPPRDVTLTSMNPDDPAIVSATVIQGSAGRSVISITNNQTSRTLVTGFTIRGGGGSVFLADFVGGGGLYCYRSGPAIVGNIIEANDLGANTNEMTKIGGGILSWEASPRIERNIIRDNGADIGAGLLCLEGAPVVQDNWIYSNLGAVAGGCFLLGMGSSFINNTVVENVPDGVYVDSVGRMINNIIVQEGEGPAVQAFGDVAWLRYNNIWVPNGFPVLLQRNEGTNVVFVQLDPSGTNGNIAADPLFLDAAQFNFNLSSNSPCINAGELSNLRSPSEFDINGDSRVFAFRVDLGASEFSAERDFAPVASAGLDRTVFWEQGPILLDGSGSADPNGSVLNYHWVQTGGPAVELAITNHLAAFVPDQLGAHTFQLVVDDGVLQSEPDSVVIVVTNLPPIASAGMNRSMRDVPEIVTLDGSHSLDPEGHPLSYEWLQVGGVPVALSDAASVRPVFRPTQASTYVFRLIVRDPFGPSRPEFVTLHLGLVDPIANPGPVRYAGRTAILLDGTASFAPNSSDPIEYAWRQVSGFPVRLSATNVSRPSILGIQQTNVVRELEFELIVRAGGRTSAPVVTKVIVVPAWNNTTLNLVNPPFNTNRPTVFAFGGGNCDTGGSMNPPGTWTALANVFTASFSRDASSPSSDPRYFGYGDQLIVAISAFAPYYNQRIQTIGFSTGCMPASDVAERFNIFYRDPRYLVNRVTYLDSGCGRDYSANISNLKSNRFPGKQFWVDNYYSSAGRFRVGALNVQFPVPPANHETPNTWYFGSWSPSLPYRTNTFNRGVIGGAFFGSVGPGRNYQLETESTEYHFGWIPPVSTSYPLQTMTLMQSNAYSARLPGAVELVGPANGELASAGRAIFSCLPVMNAVRYQLLVGPTTNEVESIVWEGDAPPTEPIRRLPYLRTCWTVRAIDAFGTTSWAGPRFVVRDSDGDVLTDEQEVVVHGTDPDNWDTDGDGHSDGHEITAWSNPFVMNHGLQLFCNRVPVNQLRFSWFTQPGLAYTLETLSDLEGGAWETVNTFAASATGAPIVHTIPMPSEARRLFRVRGVPGE